MGWGSGGMVIIGCGIGAPGWTMIGPCSGERDLDLDDLSDLAIGWVYGIVGIWLG